MLVVVLSITFRPGNPQEAEKGTCKKKNKRNTTFPGRDHPQPTSSHRLGAQAHSQPPGGPWEENRLLLGSGNAAHDPPQQNQDPGSKGKRKGGYREASSTVSHGKEGGATFTPSFKNRTEERPW